MQLMVNQYLNTKARSHKTVMKVVGLCFKCLNTALVRSKHLLMLPSQRDILRCWSAAALEEHSKKADRAGNQFERELQRRAAKRAKRAAKAKS